MSTLTASLMAILMAVPSVPTGYDPTPVPHQIARSDWKAQPGDRVVVDTQNNQGYLIHADGQYLKFPVVTGQRRWVYYIGRSYNASTPNWNWVAKSSHIKGDRVTFGPTGRFLRLYKDGVDHTAYGFHEYRTDEEMFEDADGNLAPASERYRSMGCVIVKTAMMDLIMETWEINGGLLNVTTQYGVDDIAAEIIAYSEQTEELEKL